MKLEKVIKHLKKDLLKAYKSKKNTIVVFKYDTRFEYEITKYSNNCSKKIVLRKDCASVTKNGEYHKLKEMWFDLCGADMVKRKPKENIDKLLRKTLSFLILHKCSCKKDQDKKAKSFISNAKRINGNWVY